MPVHACGSYYYHTVVGLLQLLHGYKREDLRCKKVSLYDRLHSLALTRRARGIKFPLPFYVITPFQLFAKLARDAVSEWAI